MTWDRSNTATGIANASEIALQTSISGSIRGSVPSFLKRRSSDSAAHRYWVGLRPIAEKVRRQARISGSSDSGPPVSRDLAVAW